jgi:hypothetical protein
MYADDVILLSISLRHMQHMVNICVQEFAAIGMSLNISKSGCMRIGERHIIAAKPISINDLPLDWMQEIRYLGINIISGKKFKINLQATKHKFFGALNGILGKVGPNSAPDVLCSLIESRCVSILLFAAESISWSKKSIRSLENAYNQSFYKIFKTFDKQSIEYCQYYMGYLPVQLLLNVRKLNFLTKVNDDNLNVMLALLRKNDNEYSSLCAKYNFPQNLKFFNFKNAMWTYFESQLTL